MAYLCLLLFCATFNWAAKIDRPERQQLDKLEEKVKGHLFVATNPSNANIFVDEKLLGKTSEKGGIFELQVSKIVGITSKIDAGMDVINVTDASPFAAGDTIVVAGIGKSEIARIKTKTNIGANITLVQPLKNEYDTNAKIYRRRIVRIEMQFYQPKRIDVRIVEGEITRAPFCTLSRGQTRALTVVSDPLNAYVYIDNKLQYPFSYLVTDTGNSIEDDLTLVQVKDVSPFELSDIVILDDDDSKSIKAMIRDIDELQNIITLEVHKGKTIQPNMFTAEQNGYIKSYSPFQTPCSLRDKEAGKYEIKLVSENKKKVWHGEIELEVGGAKLIDVKLVDDDLPPKANDPPFLINNGDKVTSSLTVWLSFNVDDETEVAEALISNDGQSWTTKKYTPQLKWELLPHPGKKTIHVRFTDPAKNKTQKTYTAEIELIPPYGMQYIKTDTEDKSFYINKYEVTNVQYKKFIDETGYSIPKGWDEKYRIYPKGTANYPVVNITWKDADSYAKWLGNRLQRECRIPTEEQWRRAAKGTNKQRNWPWGSLWKGMNTNFVDWKTGQGIAPVNDFPSARSEDGVYNMSGDVWEWIAEPHDYAAPDAIQMLTDNTPKIEFRRIWGGVKINDDGQVAILDDSIEKVEPGDEGYPGVGFRCVILIKDGIRPFQNTFEL